MAGQSRTLKLSILADVDQLKKSLAQANGDVDNSSSKMGEFSKKAGLAFAAAGAAAGAYAVKLAVDGVKAAIEDEAAQIVAEIIAINKRRHKGSGSSQSCIRHLSSYWQRLGFSS